ncbi:reverse transcriptase/maturase family protein [Patescibacteria group bacterium]|nr:reverse transcriptase/maturase family protein [Patescibacteria group bacterium]
MSEIFTLEKLFKAYNDCKKGKKNTVNALNFEMHREKNLVSILEELLSGTYIPSRHILFIVTRPTPREIFAADFRDRVVHHLFHNELHLFCDNNFIRHSYANRLNKGTHRAVRAVKNFVYHNPNGYYLKLDVKSFFSSINKPILFKLVEKNIYLCVKNNKWKKDMIWLAHTIIFHDPTKNFIYKGDMKLIKLIPMHKTLFYSGKNNGLPIGNLTSQFFANIYLNELDQFVTKTLKCSNYARYVDDFIMVESKKDTLLSFIVPIRDFLKKYLDLDLHKDKICFQHVSKGIDFLGYFIKPTHMVVRQKVVRRFKSELYLRRGKEDGLFSVNDISMIKSYFGHFGHADSFNLVEKLSR